MAFVENLWKRKDGTKKPGHGQGMQWRVVWDDGGKRRTKSFKNKAAADKHKTFIEHQQNAGQYVSTTNRNTRIGELLPVWEASLIRVKPSTLKQISSEIHSTLDPKWGTWRVGEVGRRDVQAWVHELHQAGYAPRTVDTKYGKLRAFYTWCVNEEYVPVSPCRKITLPRGNNREHLFLNPAQVLTLLEHMDPHYRPLVLFLFTTGARFGEACELRVKDVDLGRCRASIARSYWRGEVTLPKTHKRRSVPLTGPMVDAVAQLIEGRDREDLVFTTKRGKRVTVDNFRELYWAPAVKRAGLPEDLRVHDARHSTAALIVSSGASVKTVQRLLGHASAAVSLDIYAGLFDSELDDAAQRMGDLLAPPPAHGGHMDPLVPSGE